MILLDRLLLLLLWVGHFSLCVALFNRLHAIRISRKIRRVLELLLLVSLPLSIGYYTRHLITSNFAFSYALMHPAEAGWFLVFPLLCWGAVIVAIPWWLWPRWNVAPPRALLANHTEKVLVEQHVGTIETHGAAANFLARLPGNEIFHLHVHQKEFHLPELPAALDGFSITHLSDLHFTGDIGRKFFDYVVDTANKLGGDVMVLSGDIIESAHCEPWLTETLGRLTAPQGRYFVLGNHDLRMPNVQRVRDILTELGFVDLGGQVQLTRWNNAPVLLAGDERPWFAGPPEDALEKYASDSELFRVLVAHTPDRFPWARQHNFAFMLAGHNHGGQVRFPLIGPLIAPSLWGTRYASGVFHESPTLMHVSRGVSGEHPIRWNCPPEVAKLILKSRGT